MYVCIEFFLVLFYDVGVSVVNFCARHVWGFNGGFMFRYSCSSSSTWYVEVYPDGSMISVMFTKRAFGGGCGEYSRCSVCW